MATADSTRVVVAALGANGLIAIAKFVAAFFTGSAATLAEAVHSVADTGNQALLLLGIKRGAKPPSDLHPFGYGGEKFFWAFIVSIMLFTVGGAFAIYEGVHKMHEVLSGTHHATGGNPLWNFGVLGVATVVESYSCWVALKEFNKARGTTPLFTALKQSRDPVVPTVLLEDFAALFGLVLALLSAVLTYFTHILWLDGFFSILIGILLCGVAVFAGRETHSLIVGEAATAKDLENVKTTIEGTPGVESVTQLLSRHLGPDDCLFAMKARFDPKLSLADVEKAIDTAESKARSALPHMKHAFIYIEPDSDWKPGAESSRAAMIERESAKTDESGG
ncbi:MAG: cation transporter [Deltaproteobacteria bacterium]|nr:cation transporter [Deltaproteobacteria bacterium]